MLLSSGNPIECHDETLSLQPMFPPKRFDNVSPYPGCSKGLDTTFRFFFKHHPEGKRTTYSLYKEEMVIIQNTRKEGHLRRRKKEDTDSC